MSDSSVVKRLPPRLSVEPWPDAWREANGFDPQSAYVELVYGGRLGPSSLLLYRRLGGVARACPEGATIDTADLSAGLGLGHSDGRWSVLARSVGRLVHFGVARWDGDVLQIRRALPPVPPESLQRLGPTAQRVHAAELARVAQQDNKPRRVAQRRVLRQEQSPSPGGPPAIADEVAL